MELAIQLCGYLILTFMGVVVPIFGILLSVFQEGVSKLTPQYEDEIGATKKNIKKQADQIVKTEEENTAEVSELIKQIEKSRKTLEKKEKVAKAKLSYLNPRKQILWLFLFLSISFVGIILAILNIVRVLSIIGSLICFGLVLVRLLKLLEVIIEVRKAIDEDRKETETRTIQLLSTLAEKEAEVFLKNICLVVNGKNVEGKEVVEITMPVNMKKSLEIVLRNNDDKMGKNAEIGFIFDHNFIIDKKGSHSIYTDKNNQIVRLYAVSIQAKTDQLFDPIVITPMKEGEYPIKTFIKGENIHPVYQYLLLKVRKPTIKDIENKLLGGQ